MVEVVDFIVKQLVDKKDEVNVTVAVKDDTTTITVKVNSSEVGKVIGKRGKIVTAIRTIAKAVGTKRNERYIVEIAD